MFQSLHEYWVELTAGGGIIGTAAAYVTAIVRKVGRIERDKADRTEVVRMFELMEQRIEKRDEEAKQSRRDLHKKFDDFAATQHEINRDMARVAGRVNGKHD